EQEIADFEKARMFRELVDWVAAIEQDAFIAVDEGEIAFAGSGRGETRIVREQVCVVVQFANIDDVRTFSRAIDRKVDAVVAEGQRRCAVGRRAARLHHVHCELRWVKGRILPKNLLSLMQPYIDSS